MISFFTVDKNKDVQSQFNNWITQIIQTREPESSIIAFNFGIVQSSKGYKIYFAGFKNYSQENDDWAVGSGDYSSEPKYFDLVGKEFKNIEWKMVQENVVKILNTFITTEDFKNSFLNHAKAITTGFDDGDLIRIK